MHLNRKLLGGCLALFTILVWGSTFISSKILLTTYTPVQIMTVRFLLAYIALWCLSPHRLRLTFRQELTFLLLGLSGCSVYFYMENTALTYTMAANVSIIVAFAPILTAILAHFWGEESFHRNTFWGFLAAFSGVILVVCNGTFILKLNPKGDLLALGAAACWAVYSVILKKVSGRFDPIPATRRTMLWGLITGIPMVLAEGAPFPVAALSAPSIFGNFLFLGLIGSALCFVLWNHAFRLLGVVATNNFIYLNPFITIVTAWIFLDEPISLLAMLGAVLITVGVVLSRPSRERHRSAVRSDPLESTP